MGRRLTARQRLFIDEYLRTGNATRAAIAAGYSPDSARSIATENLTKPAIREELDRRYAENAMPANEVLARLGDIARGDMSDFVQFVDGVRLPLVDLAGAYQAGKFHLVKKIKYIPDGGGVEFELYDKLAALSQLAKAYGLDRLTLTGPNGGPIQTESKPAHDLSKLSSDELRAYRAMVAKMADDEPADAG